MPGYCAVAQRRGAKLAESDRGGGTAGLQVAVRERLTELLVDRAASQPVKDHAAQKFGVGSLDLFDLLGQIMWKAYLELDRASIPHRRFRGRGRRVLKEGPANTLRVDLSPRPSGGARELRNSLRHNDNAVTYCDTTSYRFTSRNIWFPE